MTPSSTKLLLAAVCGALAGCARPATVAAPSASLRQFSHQQTTSASPEAIWARWMDVRGWPDWDEALRSSRLRDPMGLGARGRLVPRRGIASPFVVSEYDPPHAYAFTTSLPGATLTVRRSLAESEGDTRFVHAVSFDGRRAEAWAKRLGPGLRDALGAVMAELARQAQLESAR